MKLKHGYRWAKALLALPLAALLGGCSGVGDRLARLEGNPVYEIGRVGLHLTVRDKAAGLMVGYLEDHPQSADKLPMLSLAWDHFWEGRNPFDRAAFDRWLEGEAAKLQADPYELATLEDAAGLLWAYLEAGEDGYVKVDDRSRRIVDSLVAGLRSGYRQWRSAQPPRAPRPVPPTPIAG